MSFNIKKYYSETLYRNSIAIILNSTFAAAFGLIFWIISARKMSANELGLAAAAISTASLILGLSTMGLGWGLMRYLPESKNKNKLYSSVVVIPLVLALIFAFVFISFINVLSPALKFLKEGWFLTIFMTYVMISSIYSIQNTTLIAIRRADLNFIQNLFLGLRIPIILFIAPLGSLGIFSALDMSYMIAFIFGALILTRYGFSFTLKLDIIGVKNMLKFSLGNYIAGLILIAPVTVMPIMIVNIVGAKENAYFYIAYSVSGLLTMIPTAVSMSLFVEGSHNLPLKENVLKSIKLIMLLLFPALVFIFLFGDLLLLLFSKEYSEQSFELLRLLSVSSVFYAITLIYLSIKKVQKDLRMMNYVSFALSVLIIGLGYLSLLKYGLIGLGYSWLYANLMVSIFVVGLIIFKETWI